MLVTAFEANAHVPDMKTVTERLLHEERKRKERNTVPETLKEEVLVTKQQKKRGLRCHFCNKFGHIQRNCLEKERKYSSTSGSTVNPRVFGKKHRVYCTEANDQPVDSDADEIGLVVRHALATGVKVPSSSGNWIVDSGSTTHICNDRNSFVS